MGGAYNENPAVVEVLLAAGADPTLRTNDGRTLGHLAAQNNANPAVLEALMSNIERGSVPPTVGATLAGRGARLALATALFMTVWRPSTRSAENSWVPHTNVCTIQPPAGQPRRGKRLRMCSCPRISGEVVYRSVDGRLRGPRFWWGACSTAAGPTSRC